jgi:spermidine synthase
VRFLYRNDRYRELETILAETEEAANSDERPVVYRETLRLWASRFIGPVGRAPGTPPGALTAAAALFALAFLVALAAGRRHHGFGRIILVGAAGFAGMLLETLVLLRYQVQQGILYRDIGILLTGFMAGLTAGALALERWGRSGDRLGMRLTGAGLLVGFASVSSLVAVSFKAGRTLSLPEAFMLLFVAGGLVAGVFALASFAAGEDRTEIGSLYAADLAGGSLAAVLGTLLLIPLAGMTTTAVLIVPVVLACLVLV